jgi:hypothetical protein
VTKPLRSITRKADVILAEIREETIRERALMDDDLPHVPGSDPLASAQSRRAERVG